MLSSFEQLKPTEIAETIKAEEVIFPSIKHSWTVVLSSFHRNSTLVSTETLWASFMDAFFSEPAHGAPQIYHHQQIGVYGLLLLHHQSSPILHTLTTNASSQFVSKKQITSLNLCSLHRDKSYPLTKSYQSNKNTNVTPPILNFPTSQRPGTQHFGNH